MKILSQPLIKSLVLLLATALNQAALAQSPSTSQDFPKIQAIGAACPAADQLKLSWSAQKDLIIEFEAFGFPSQLPQHARRMNCVLRLPVPDFAAASLTSELRTIAIKLDGVTDMSRGDHASISLRVRSSGNLLPASSWNYNGMSHGSFSLRHAQQLQIKPRDELLINLSANFNSEEASSTSGIWFQIRSLTIEAYGQN